MCKSPLTQFTTLSAEPLAIANNNVRRITVPVEIDVDLDAYLLNYGHNDPAEAESFTGEIVRDAANERFALLGWATIVTTATDSPS